MHSLLEHQNQLHADASRLLQDTLLPLLSRYGNVEVSGSYKYQLLYHPDIDFYIINEDLTKQLYVDLCADLLATSSVAKFKSFDRVDFPHAHGSDRPTGYYLSPTIHTANNAWTCDIWLQKPEWVNSKIYRYDDTLTNLTDDQRVLILTLKQEFIEAGRYGVGKEFESVTIYDAVLQNPTMNIEQIRQVLSPN